MRPCVQCGETGVYEIDKAQVPNYEYSNSVEPLTLTAHYGPTGKTGLFGGTVSKRVGIEMSARVCRGCGVIAWYVRDLGKLAAFAREGSGGVRSVD